MKITKNLAVFATDALGMDRAHLADITKPEAIAAITEAVSKGLTGGTLTVEKFAELTKDEEDPLAAARKMIGDAVSAANAPVATALTELANVMKGFSKPASEVPAAETPAEPSTEKGFGSEGKGKALMTGGVAGAGETPSADDNRIRLKKAIERYSNVEKSFDASRTVPVTIAGDSDSGIPSRSVTGYSQADEAIAGATMKWLLNRQASVDGVALPHHMKMTEHDTQLMQYAANELPWVGPVGLRNEDSESADFGWATGKKLQDFQIKAVLDDATSGGLEAVPTVFDSLAIVTPLLHSQLYQYVDSRVTSRRRVEGFKIGNPTMSWTAEGSVPATFDTDGFISAFDTDIKPCVGWIEVGLDFEADAPNDIGALIVGRYGERAMKEMDDVIATGNGTTQPLGIATTVGFTSSPFANGATGPVTVSDYESLYFAIPKEFREQVGARFAFMANDVAYKRARGIQVGTADQRRIYGMGYSSYRLMEERYAINGTLPNTKVFAVMLNKYIAYRRAGFSVRRVTEDSDLAKTNKALYVFRMRMGGQMSHAACVAGATNAQT